MNKPLFQNKKANLKVLEQTNTFKFYILLITDKTTVATVKTVLIIT